MEYITKKITDKNLIRALAPYLVNDKCCVAGGFFKDYYSHKKCKDIDIFCEDDESADEIKKAFNHVFKKDFSTENVTRYHDKKMQIDVITKIKGNPEDILNNFDFNVCKYAFRRLDNDFYSVYHIDFFTDLYSKTISTENCKLNYPVDSLRRMIRYASYGFMPTKESIFDISYAVNELDGEQVDSCFYDESGSPFDPLLL